MEQHELNSLKARWEVVSQAIKHSEAHTANLKQQLKEIEVAGKSMRKPEDKIDDSKVQPIINVLK